MLVASCVSCLVKTCTPVLSCSAYYVCEQEVYNATHCMSAYNAFVCEQEVYNATHCMSAMMDTWLSKAKEGESWTVTHSPAA